MINRYKIEIEYDGSGFHGWQYQKNHKSVQSAIQKAIFKFSGQDIIIEGAGRTDAGVHALAQVAHFDLETNLDDFHMQQAINYHLLNDNVTIISIKK